MIYAQFTTHVLFFLHVCTLYVLQSVRVGYTYTESDSVLKITEIETKRWVKYVVTL